MSAASGPTSTGTPHVSLMQDMEELFFNSVRVLGAHGGTRLDSSPFRLQFRFSGALASAVNSWLHTHTIAEFPIHADVVTYDNKPIFNFALDGKYNETLVAEPSITELHYSHGVLSCFVKRRLPLSSGHGQRRFRLAFLFRLAEVWAAVPPSHTAPNGAADRPGAELLITSPFEVLAKQGPSENRKQKYANAFEYSPQRLSVCLAGPLRGMLLANATASSRAIDVGCQSCALEPADLAALNEALDSMPTASKVRPTATSTARGAASTGGSSPGTARDDDSVAGSHAGRKRTRSRAAKAAL